MQHSDRWLYLAAYFGMATGVTAIGFALATGSVFLLAASVLLTGSASLVPAIVALRQSRRIAAASGHHLSPATILELGQSPSSEPEPPRPELDWRLVMPETCRPTIH